MDYTQTYVGKEGLREPTPRKRLPPLENKTFLSDEGEVHTADDVVSLYIYIYIHIEREREIYIYI